MIFRRPSATVSSAGQLPLLLFGRGLLLLLFGRGLFLLLFAHGSSSSGSLAADLSSSESLAADLSS